MLKKKNKKNKNSKILMFSLICLIKNLNYIVIHHFFSYIVNNININSPKMLFLLLFLYKTYINSPKMQFFLLFLYKTYINSPKMLFFLLFLYKTYVNTTKMLNSFDICMNF